MRRLMPDAPIATPAAVPPPAPSPAPGRRTLLARLCLAGVLNLLIGLVVSHGYLATVPAATSALGWTAILVAWVSTLGSFAAIATGLACGIIACFPRRWLLMTVVVVGFGFLQVVLYGDVVCYGLYRMHYNQLVWELLTTPGAGDSLVLGRGTIISIILVVGGILLAEAATIWLVLHRHAARFTSKRWMIGLPCGLLAIVALDKFSYAAADLAGRTEITRVERYFPLYQRLTVRRFAMKRGLIDRKNDHVVLSDEASALAYPRTPVQVPAEPKRLNVLILAIEGARFDMLDPAVMPRVHAFAQRHTWGRHHFSGGNATRFGLGSLFYGIHATYFHQLHAERQPPVLINLIKQMGYRISVQSCTDLNFPEFRQTVFLEVPDAITDHWPDELPRVQRDRAVTDNLLAHITATGDAPFFGFGFYDASHSSYIYPPEFERYLPVTSPKDVDYLDIAGNAQQERLKPLFNRYRNSLGYIDAQIGRLLDALEERQLLDRTLVFIAGDHGEEFGEQGFFGHNGTFSRYQTQTLFVAHIPGMAPGPIERLTSHVDVVPTILTAIGVTTPVAEYSTGTPLQLPSDRDHVISVSWDSLGIIDQESVMVRGFGTQNPVNEFFDQDYRPHPGGEAALEQRRPRLHQLVEEMRRFSR